jgi:subtilisin family serine protease
MHQPRLPARVVAVLACLVVVVGVSMTAASAAPTAAAPVAGPAAAPAGPATTVTLITGDKATVARDAAGTAQVTMTPAGDHHTSFTTLRRGADVYVVPSSVARLVPGTLDLELFNVTGLLAQGYGDERRDSTPVIIRGGASLRAAGTDARSLPSIGATAVDLPKKSGLATASARAAGGTKVWLDRRVTASELDGNLTQIGVPQAWDAGLSGAGVDIAVLDSGIDANHPDLRGKVIEEANFTDEPTAEDGHGHGTHVASIIGGSGAAAGGARKGVAYGARLLSGKVLGADGSGRLSWLIEGMEWAAAQGADIANVSLGALPGDGDDPTAQALDTLSEETGTLFVVAAGNMGPDFASIGTPGVAASALTVGAAGPDGLAPYFSGQGPAPGSYRAKPDITAPGVDITGALAGSDGYTQLSGTSQATPHVTGAAALLAQRHPDWDWRRIKNALMTTADAQYGIPSPYVEGAGLLDVPGALSDTLHADRGTVDFGYLRDGEHPGTSTVTVTLTNDGTAAEAVTLTDEARDVYGDLAPADLVTVTPASVTVPPGGTTSVTVALHPANGTDGVFSGAVSLARPGKQPTRMPLSWYHEAPRRDITVTVLNRLGKPDAYGSVWLANMAEMWPSTGGGFTSLDLDENGRGTARMAPGPISAIARVVTPASGRTPETVSFAGTPELTVDRDMSYTIDARKAKQVRPVSVEGAATTVSTMSIHYGRQDAKGDGGISDGIYATGEELARGTVFAQPTKPARSGRTTFETHWELDQGNDRYSVVLGAPAVPDPPAYQARRSGLARVDADYRSLGGRPDRYQTYRTGFTELVSSTVVWVHPLAAPTKRTEWVTAGPDVQWRQCVAGPQEGVAVLCQPTTTYRAGERRPAVWFRSVAPAVTTASHNRQRIELPVDVSDGEHEGPVYDLPAAGNDVYRLYRDGVELPRFDDSWYFDTPPGPATFRLEHTSKPDPARLPIGTSTSTVWTFPSQAPADENDWDTKPRLLSLEYQPGADGQGRLPAWRIFDLGIRVVSFAGGAGFRLEPGRLRFWASTDRGGHWREAIVIPNRDGSYRAIVPGVVTKPGQRVSIRAEATAAEGRTVKQTLVDAYPVR